MLVMLTVGSKIKSSLINMPCALDEDFRQKFYDVSAKFLVGTPLTDVNLALIPKRSRRCRGKNIRYASCSHLALCIMR
ncbi:MAG: hypothetical protein ACLTSM_08480 [Eubacterium sp.]